VGPESLGGCMAPDKNPLFCVFVYMGAMDLTSLSVRPPYADWLESAFTAGSGESTGIGRNLVTN